MITIYIFTFVWAIISIIQDMKENETIEDIFNSSYEPFKDDTRKRIIEFTCVAFIGLFVSLLIPTKYYDKPIKANQIVNVKNNIIIGDSILAGIGNTQYQKTITLFVMENNEPKVMQIPYDNTEIIYTNKYKPTIIQFESIIDKNQFINWFSIDKPWKIHKKYKIYIPINKINHIGNITKIKN